MSEVENRLREYGIVLPEPRTWASTNRTGCVVLDDFAFTSGHGKKKPGAEVPGGWVGSLVTEDDAVHLAEQCALAMLRSLKTAIGDLDRIRKVVKITGYVSSDPGFHRQFAVIDGASDLLIKAFGSEIGQHARTAIGVASLPRGMSVELEGTFALTA